MNPINFPNKLNNEDDLHKALDIQFERFLSLKAGKLQRCASFHFKFVPTLKLLICAPFHFKFVHTLKLLIWFNWDKISEQSSYADQELIYIF